MTASAPVRVFVVVNTANADARPVARLVVEALIVSGAHVSGVTEDIEALDMTSTAGIELLPSDLSTDLPGGRAGADVVVVFGGDGTILRAAELAEPRTPLLGVNLGHVGFLAEAEPEDVTFVVESLIERRWSVEERTRLSVSILRVTFLCVPSSLMWSFKILAVSAVSYTHLTLPTNREV